MVSAFNGSTRPQPFTKWHSYRLTQPHISLPTGGNKQHKSKPRAQYASGRPAPCYGEGKTQQKPSPKLEMWPSKRETKMHCWALLATCRFNQRAHSRSNNQ